MLPTTVLGRTTANWQASGWRERFEVGSTTGASSQVLIISKGTCLYTRTSCSLPHRTRERRSPFRSIWIAKAVTKPWKSWKSNTLPRENGTANEEAEQDASQLEDAEDEQASESNKVPAHRSDAEVSAHMLQLVKSVNGQRFMCLCHCMGGMGNSSTPSGVT